MRDETKDESDPGRLANAGRAAGRDDLPAGRDDSHPVAVDGEDDPPPQRYEGALPAESDGSGAAHRRWMAVAAACAVASAVLLFTVGVNAAFVAAVLGVVAWFWDQRNRIRANLIEDEHSEEGRDELEEFGDEEGRDAGSR
ncbi:MAG TPA: hypothetical protein VK421_00040 [Pyrinomonadaceae bacterium]|nr:hypothetical protein [Pyrinomonadaceae bacterium]